MDADSVAAVVAFLASDEASAVHGSIQTVDHGHLAGERTVIPTPVGCACSTAEAP
jgi:enoyl-[acyl-carrier-protein] reductase (NADH)